MAQRCGLSYNAVSRIWRAFGLQAHRTETFKLSSDPICIQKVRDSVGLYVDPPDRALVLCVDETSHIQALDRTRTLLPLRQGRRNGASMITCAVVPRRGSPRWIPRPAR